LAGEGVTTVEAYGALGCPGDSAQRPRRDV